MEIKEAFSNILNQLEEVLVQINNDEIASPVSAFSGSSLGQHFRHSMEFIQCLMNGYQNDQVNYDLRERSVELETDVQFIIEQIHVFNRFLASCDVKKKLELCINYDPDTDQNICIPTNLERELAYNIEHIIHHMALVKIGIKETCPNVILPPGFGIAISTIKYQNSIEHNT